MPELIAYACGETRHRLSGVLRGAPRTERVFPANAFLYDDGERRILIDTGYAPAPWAGGLGVRLYQRLLPPHLEPGSRIQDQLDPASVTHVVLTHLHADHLGGLSAFTDATLVLDAAQARALAHPRSLRGEIASLVPEWLERGTRIVIDRFEAGPHGLRVSEAGGVLGPEVLLVDLPGHSRGHLGVLIGERTLIAGDAAWGRDLLGQEHRMRLLPRAIADDARELASTGRMLLAAEAGGVRLLFSHDAHPTGVDLL